MKKLNAVLIDDEINSLGTLKQLLQKYCPQVNIIALADTAEKGILAIKKEKPEVVFLDIEMPYLNGFQLLDQLRDINFSVIFTTAYDEYAIKAFKYCALDYLLKPIDKEELILAVKRAGVHKRLYLLQLEILNSVLLGGNKPDRLALACKDGYRFVSFSDIIYCEAENNYTNFYLKDGTTYLASKTLGNIEELLQEYFFFRIHKQYLVNLNHIIKYKKGPSAFIVMSNNATLNIARDRKEDFNNLFLKV